MKNVGGRDYQKNWPLIIFEEKEMKPRAQHHDVFYVMFRVERVVQTPRNLPVRQIFRKLLGGQDQKNLDNFRRSSNNAGYPILYLRLKKVEPETTAAVKPFSSINPKIKPSRIIGRLRKLFHLKNAE